MPIVQMAAANRQNGPCRDAGQRQRGFRKAGSDAGLTAALIRFTSGVEGVDVDDVRALDNHLADGEIHG